VEELVWISFVYFLSRRCPVFVAFRFPFRETDVAQNFYGCHGRRRSDLRDVLVSVSGGHPSELLSEISKCSRLSTLSADKRLDHSNKQFY